MTPFESLTSAQQEAFLQQRFVNKVVSAKYLQTYPKMEMATICGKLESVAIGCTMKDEGYALLRLVNHKEQVRIPIEDILNNLRLLN